MIAQRESRIVNSVAKSIHIMSVTLSLYSCNIFSTSCSTLTCWDVFHEPFLESRWQEGVLWPNNGLPFRGTLPVALKRGASNYKRVLFQSSYIVYHFTCLSLITSTSIDKMESWIDEEHGLTSSDDGNTRGQVLINRMTEWGTLHSRQ